MANGFFLGGAAEGMMGAQKMALAERSQTEDTGLRTRGLELQERQFNNTVSQQVAKEADTRIAETMAAAAETIKAGLEGGAAPEKIRQTVTPLLQSAQAIASRVGRDPAALAAQLDAQLTNPNPVARAGVKGTAAGVERVEQARTEQQQPEGNRVEISPFKDPKDQIAEERQVRTDFDTQAKPFIGIKNNFANIRGLPNDPKKWTAADDIAVTFSFLKMLDSVSTASPGEQAAVRGGGGVIDQLQVLADKLTTEKGAQLGPGLRAALRERAQSLYYDSLINHNDMRKEYAGLATRSGLRAPNVVNEHRPAQDRRPIQRTDSESTWRENLPASFGIAVPAGAGIPPPPEGFTIISPRR